MTNFQLYNFQLSRVILSVIILLNSSLNLFSQAPPSNLSFPNPLTSTTATLSWTAPIGPTPSTYSIWYRVCGTSTWITNTVLGVSTAHVLSSLFIGSKYEIQMRANYGGLSSSAWARYTPYTFSVYVQLFIQGYTNSYKHMKDVRLTQGCSQDPTAAALVTIQLIELPNTILATNNDVPVTTSGSAYTTFALNNCSEMSPSKQYKINVQGCNFSQNCSLPFSPGGISYSFDFSSLLNSVQSGNQVFVGSTGGNTATFYSGDMNNDGDINAADEAILKTFEFKDGCIFGCGDLDGDGNACTISDLNILRNNILIKTTTGCVY